MNIRSRIESNADAARAMLEKLIAENKQAMVIVMPPEGTDEIELTDALCKAVLHITLTFCAMRGIKSAGATTALATALQCMWIDAGTESHSDFVHQIRGLTQAITEQASDPTSLEVMEDVMKEALEMLGIRRVEVPISGGTSRH